MEDSGIEFSATVLRVRTMVDGGKRVELDLPEDSTMQAAALMEYQRFGVSLRIQVTPLGAVRKPHRSSPDPGLLEG